MGHAQTVSAAELKPKLERAIGTACTKVRALVEESPDFFPIYTQDGRWKHDGALWTDWCAGFLAGQMWLIHQQTGETWWRTTAEHYSRLLEHKQYDRAVHDLGFIFLNTYLPWYRETGDAHLNQVLITAGQTLALRFQPKGQYLCSFIGTHSLFIDIMMNVPIGPTAAPPMKVPSIRKPASSCTSQPIRATVERVTGHAGWRGLFTDLVRSTPTLTTRPIWMSPAAMPTIF